MKRNAGKVLLAMTVMLAAFIGKGNEAKAYEIVGGKAFISLLENVAMSEKELERLTDGTIANGYEVIDLWMDESGMPLMTGGLLGVMNEYVPKIYFDYDWYLQKHPELIELCGTDKDAVYAYYANIGQANGWQGRIAPDKLIPWSNFDYVRYAAENPDVAAMVGEDQEALYRHYITCGAEEGRKGYPMDGFDAYTKVYEVSSQITNDAMSDEEKIRAVHDWMCLNIAYDYDSYVSGTVSEGSSGVYGPMKYGVALCGGYAETFKAFMDALGIECESVSGLANGGYHGWNRVKVNGEDYYIDVTWDDPDDPDEPEFIRYIYYLSKDPNFDGSHMMFTDLMDYYRYVEGWDV